MSAWWSWVPDVRGMRRGGERVYVLQRGSAAVAQLVLPLPFRGDDPEHGETGAVDPRRPRRLSCPGPLGCGGPLRSLGDRLADALRRARTGSSCEAPASPTWASRTGARAVSGRARIGPELAPKRGVTTIGNARTTHRAESVWPFVQWQDSGLWKRASDRRALRTPKYSKAHKRKQRNGFPPGSPFLSGRHGTAKHTERLSGQVQGKYKMRAA